MEKRRAVVALDDRQRPAGLEHAPSTAAARRPAVSNAPARSTRRRDRSSPSGNGNRKRSAVWKVDVGEARVAGRGFRGIERGRGNVNGREMCPRIVSGENDCLRADAAAGLEHAASRRVNRVVVKQFRQGLGLVVQPLVLPIGIAVNVWAVADRGARARRTGPTRRVTAGFRRAQKTHGGRVPARGMTGTALTGRDWRFRSATSSRLARPLGRAILTA